MTHKFKMSKLTLAMSSAVLAAILWAPAAQAFSVGNAAIQPTMTSHDLLGDIPFWVILEGDIEDPTPVPVSYDPTAGPWEKTLNLRGENLEGQVVDVMALEGLPFGLLEILTVDGDTPWTDWHEEILTEGWAWVDPEDNDLLSTGIYYLADLMQEEDELLPIPGLTIDMTATTYDFLFNPLGPGAEIGIVKYLAFTGFDDQDPEEMFSGSVVISEYPTVPEPSTFILLGAGLAGLAFWRKKRA